MEGEIVYIRGLVLLLFCFLSFSPYTVICSSYLNKYLEPLHPHLSPHLCLCPYICPCLCSHSHPQLYSHPYPALPLLLLCSCPTSVPWLVSLLLNMDPLQLLHVTALEI
jgi:hypothetical protein